MYTLRKKSTKDWLKYMDGEFYTSMHPVLISDQASLEELQEYAKNFDGVDLDISDVEIFVFAVLGVSEYDHFIQNTIGHLSDVYTYTGRNDIKIELDSFLKW